MTVDVASTEAVSRVEVQAGRVRRQSSILEYLNKTRDSNTQQHPRNRHGHDEFDKCKALLETIFHVLDSGHAECQLY